MFERLKRFFAKAPPDSLVEYTYIDRTRLTAYVAQLGSLSKHEKVPSWTAGLTLTGPSVSAAQTSTARRLSDHEMVTKLTNYLWQTKQLKEGRPKDRNDVEHGPFWIERMTASKAIFRVTQPSLVGGLRELAVWVSQPADEDLNNSGYSEGTFLYLIESYWNDDNALVGTTFSGFSAFTILTSELASPCNFPEATRFAHLKDSPLAEMEALGALVQPPRKIECLYRLRHLTDEAYFHDSKGQHRSNDAFGYPIFVAAL